MSSLPLEHVRKNRDAHLEELKELLRIPSVSAQSKHAKDVERAAAWVAASLERAGMERVETFPTKGHPIVYASWEGAPGAPTVLVYGHYDVQPPEPVELWDSPPFEPTLRDGKLYARGATDDKGQMFTHVKAVEAHLATTVRLPVNVKFLIEGEEEVGSENLDRFINANKKLLACDSVLISDTHMPAKGVPAITTALRGLAYYQIDVTGPRQDLHSGTFGGTVMNPAEAVAHLLAAMKDPKTGKVRIPGFYDDVKRLSAKEKASLAKQPHSDTRYKRELGVKELFGEARFTTLERVGARPTFEVNGIYGGYQGEGAKTVIPSEAHAKVSMRLVADQDPEDIGRKFEAYAKKVAPPGVRIKVTSLSGGYPFKVDPDHPAVSAAVIAMEAAFGKAPLFTAEGGSIPVTAMFLKKLGVPSVLMGFGLPDENLHAPNEHFDVDNFHKGIESSVRFFEAYQNM